MVPKSAKFAGLSALAAGLVWLIATTTLPFALAESAPEVALWLNPNNPKALVAIAEKRHAAVTKRIEELTRTPSKTAQNEVGATEQSERVSNSHGAANAVAPNSGIAEDEVVASLRAEIRDLATRAIAVDPLNATAYRLLAGTYDDLSKVSRLMDKSAKLSRRESLANLWRINRSLAGRDYASALAEVDTVLRARPTLTIPFVPTLAELVTTSDEALQELAATLAKDPPWRRTFLIRLPRETAIPEVPMKLLFALRDLGSRVESIEIAPYLKNLIANGQPEIAYYTWLQFLPPEELEGLGLLYNADFAKEPSGQPFDWSVSKGRNVVAMFIPAAAAAGRSQLRLTFGGGRAEIPRLEQIVVLAPGRYRLSGDALSHLSGKRGLSWQVQCLYRDKTPLGQSQPISIRMKSWQRFEFAFEVPDDEKCKAQRVVLVHGARSASEEFLSGSISYSAFAISQDTPRLTSTEGG